MERTDRTRVVSSHFTHEEGLRTIRGDLPRPAERGGLQGRPCRCLAHSAGDDEPLAVRALSYAMSFVGFVVANHLIHCVRLLFPPLCYLLLLFPTPATSETLRIGVGSRWSKYNSMACSNEVRVSEQARSRAASSCCSTSSDLLKPP